MGRQIEKVGLLGLHLRSFFDRLFNSVLLESQVSDVLLDEWLIGKADTSFNSNPSVSKINNILLSCIFKGVLECMLKLETIG